MADVSTPPLVRLLRCCVLLECALLSSVLPLQCCAGLHTTPQLHWMLRRRNRGQPGSERDYYASLAAAFQQLVHDCPAPQQQVQWITGLHHLLPYAALHLLSSMLRRPKYAAWRQNPRWS